MSNLEIIERPLYKGHIRVFSKEIATGKNTIIVDKPNIITYEGTEVLVKSLANIPHWGITHIYGEYGTDFVAGVLVGTATKIDTVSTMRNAPGKLTTGAEEPILHNSFQRTNNNYSDNVVSFYASISDSALDTKVFGGAGLIMRYNSMEYLVAHQYFTGITKLAGHEIVIIWSITAL